MFTIYKFVTIFYGNISIADCLRLKYWFKNNIFSISNRFLRSPRVYPYPASNGKHNVCILADGLARRSFLTCYLIINRLAGMSAILAIKWTSWRNVILGESNKESSDSGCDDRRDRCTFQESHPSVTRGNADNISKGISSPSEFKIYFILKYYLS